MLKGDINCHYREKILLTSFRGKSKRNKLGMLAQEAYESAANIENNIESKAMIYYKIGNVHAELFGDKEKGEEYWKKAASLAPDSKAAQLAWKKLSK